MNIVDYRDFLKGELEQQVQKRPQYSLRAFAKDAGVSASFLSQLLSHKKKLSLEKAVQLASKLSWDDEKVKFFSILVQFQNCDDLPTKEQLKVRLLSFEKKFPVYYDLQEEQFRIIADWWHFAILELTTVQDFKSDFDWIAQRLKISVNEVQDAVQRLKRLDLLTETEDGFHKVKNDYTIGEVASQAIRIFHKQNLARAEAAIESQSLQERNFMGGTMAIDPANIPLAKKMILDFTKQLMTALEGGDKKVIYHFSSQLFRAQEL